MNGWIKLHKSITEHWLWDDPVILRAWLDLLMSVNYTDKKVLFNGKLIIVKAGQIITSIRKLSERWGCTRRKASRIIQLFTQDNMVELKTDRNGTLLTVVNYGKYQDMRDTESTTQDTTESTTQSTTESSQHKNIKNNKEYKKESEEPELAPVKPFRHPIGKYNNVFLSNEEAAKLMNKFGEADTKKAIESLSNHLATKKNNYRDDAHYAVLCKWIQEDKEKPKTTKSKAQDFKQRDYTDEQYLAMERKKLGIT